MSQIIKSYLGIFLLLFLVFLQAAVLKAGSDMSDARHFFEQAAAQMEAGNLSEGVIETARKESADKGYHLTVDLVSETKDRMAELKLEYKVTIPFLNVKSSHTIEGIAR